MNPNFSDVFFDRKQQKITGPPALCHHLFNFQQKNIVPVNNLLLTKSVFKRGTGMENYQLRMDIKILLKSSLNQNIYSTFSFCSNRQSQSQQSDLTVDSFIKHGSTKKNQEEELLKPFNELMSV